MPIRPRGANGLILPLSSYKKLKAFHSGGYFWDPSPQSLIRQYLSDYLAPVEISEDAGETVGWFRRFVGGDEVLYKSSPLNGRSIPEAQLDKLKAGLKALEDAARANDTQQHNRELIFQFRLPHPSKDPELYRLRGPFWARRLEILWGCEKIQDSSLPPSDAIGLLRADRFYGLKRWLFWILAAGLALFLLWALARLIGTAYQHAVNRAPVADGVVQIEDRKARQISIHGLQKSEDLDGEVVSHIVDWGDGTSEIIPGNGNLVKTFSKDGDYIVKLRAIDNLGKRSAPKIFPVKLDHEQQERIAEADRKREADERRAVDLEAKKRAAEELARAEAESRIIAEAAEKARLDAEAATRKRVAEEAAEAARKAESAKAEEAAEAARKELAKAEGTAEAARKPESANNVQTDGATAQRGLQQHPPTPDYPSDFKDVTTGRPVRPISFNKPSYPRQALYANEEGSVRVQFTVSTSGKTKDLKVVSEKNGYYFRASVLEAIKKATFNPAVIDGVPIEQQLLYEVSFVINKD